jgi:hypothetical protein
MSVVTVASVGPPLAGRPRNGFIYATERPCMLPVALATGVVDTLANDPVLVVLVAVLLLAVFGGYFYIRRTLMNLRDGYEDAYRGK